MFDFMSTSECIGLKRNGKWMQTFTKCAQRIVYMIIAFFSLSKIIWCNQNSSIDHIHAGQQSVHHPRNYKKAAAEKITLIELKVANDFDSNIAECRWFFTRDSCDKEEESCQKLSHSPVNDESYESWSKNILWQFNLVTFLYLLHDYKCSIKFFWINMPSNCYHQWWYSSIWLSFVCMQTNLHACRSRQEYICFRKMWHS